MDPESSSSRRRGDPQLRISDPFQPSASAPDGRQAARREAEAPTGETSTRGTPAGDAPEAVPQKPQANNVKEVDQWPSLRDILAGIVVALKDLWTNRALLILLFVFVLTLTLSITSNSTQLQAVAAAAGGALVGLLAPPPSSGQA